MLLSTFFIIGLRSRLNFFWLPAAVFMASPLRRITFIGSSFLHLWF